MLMQHLQPELVNLIAAQLDAPKDVLALERTCRPLRTAVRDTGSSSAWGQLFNAKFQELHHKQITIELVPPQSYRDALRALPLRRALHAELSGIRDDPLFRQFNPPRQVTRRLRQGRPTHQTYCDGLDRAWARFAAAPAHSVQSALRKMLEAEVRCEAYACLGLDPGPTLRFLKFKRGMALSL